MAEQRNENEIEVRLIRGPLPPAEPWRPPGVGAVVGFEGVVRPEENGRELIALDYEQYPPMTERELRKLAAETVERHGLIALRVEHSEGRVPVGTCSFRLRIASAHRAEALAAMEAFIERMKREIPLWKLPCYTEAEGGESSVKEGAASAGSGEARASQEAER